MKILQGQWISDGSDDPSLGDKATSWETASTTVTGSSSNDNNNELTMDVHAKTGSPMNFMYELGEESSYYVLQVTVVHLEGTVAAGVVSPSDFCKGWKLNKAKLFNGMNLTNGAGAEQLNFGSRPIQQGDTILVERKNNGSIVFYLNEVCLGCGFDTPNNNTTLYPCLSITGNARLQVATLSTLPTSVESTTLLNGSYNIIEAYDESGELMISFRADNIVVGGSVGNDDTNNKPIKLNMSQDGSNDDNFTISINVCNTLSMKNTILKTKDASDYIFAESNFGVYLSTGENVVLTTRMLAPPPYDEVERKLSKVMTNSWHSMEQQSTTDNNKTTWTFFNSEKHPIIKCQSIV